MRNLHYPGDDNGLAFTAPCPGAHRRRTDLMPAILSRGPGHTTPSTPGRAVSLSRIDHLNDPSSRRSMASSKSMSHLAQKKTGTRPASGQATGHQRAKTGGGLLKKPGMCQRGLNFSFFDHQIITHYYGCLPKKIRLNRKISVKVCFIFVSISTWVNDGLRRTPGLCRKLVVFLKNPTLILIPH